MPVVVSLLLGAFVLLLWMPRIPRYRKVLVSERISAGEPHRLAS